MPSFLMPPTQGYQKWRHLAPKQAAGHAPKPRQGRPPPATQGYMQVQCPHWAPFPCVGNQNRSILGFNAVKTGAKGCKKVQKGAKKLAKTCKTGEILKQSGNLVEKKHVCRFTRRFTGPGCAIRLQNRQKGAQR